MQLPTRTKAIRLSIGLITSFFVALAVYNTVENDLYAYGATLFDSAEFATCMWRTDWKLDLPSVFGHISFYSGHASPIVYIPDLLSYFFPGTRITYYALVYALLYAALIFTVFQLLVSLIPGRYGTYLAALGGLAVFCSQPVFDGSWELRYEYASPMFAILAFWAWQLRRYRQALVWFLLNAAIREDLAIDFAIPLCLLAGMQYLKARYSDPVLAKERLHWGMVMTGVSIGWTIFAITLQHWIVPQTADLFHGLYYDKENPFGHLSADLLLFRIDFLFHHRPGLWLPLVVLALSAWYFKDAELLIGAIAFLPYLCFVFFSKHEMSAELDSYKGFLITFSLLWPAIIVLKRPPGLRSAYLGLQALVLASSVSFLLIPDIHWSPARFWFRQPMSYHAEFYHDLGKQLGTLDLKRPLRASQGVLALYPYWFPAWQESSLENISDDAKASVNTLIWFQDDRDQNKVDSILSEGNFKVSTVDGTKIHIARRVIPAEAQTPSKPGAN